MGTDIHMVVQARRNNRWETVATGYDDRNYRLFAALANVRNGRGFAGVDTGDEIPYISDSRGFPSDFQVKDEMDMGYHDFSHCTLQELLDYDWNQPTVIRGVVSSEHSISLREMIGQDWFEFMDLLKEHGSPDEVRLVFGFDS